MRIEETTRRKLTAALGQIRRLLFSDFPHEAGKEALKELQVFFDSHLLRLTRAEALGNRDIVRQACITANERLFEYLPVLGFILRSTNVRNSFETYDSLLQMSKALIGPDAKVILSSEWDLSPLTYPMTFGALPKYVLLGMPSSEAANALILPLAGHELGHSSWVAESLENKYKTVLQQMARDYLKSHWSDFIAEFDEHRAISPTESELLGNMFIVQIVAAIAGLAEYQVQETYCDALGTALFGRSYLHAFHYLLAPSLGGDRPLHYPPLRHRARDMEAHGNISMSGFGFVSFEDEFRDNQPSLAPRQEFVSRAADTIASALVGDMFAEAQSVVSSKASDHVSDPPSVQAILSSFRCGVPARAPRSLADILNAGWDFVGEAAPSWNEAERPLTEWISELILKSVEVLEYRRRVSHA